MTKNSNINLSNQQTEQSTPTSKQAILIVEDNHINAMFTSLALNQIYTPVIAHDCEQAIKELESTSFALILLDINLGKGPNGVETAQRIRTMESSSNIPIVTISAFAFTGELETMINSTFTHRLPKPYTRDELLTKVKSILEMDNYAS